MTGNVLRKQNTGDAAGSAELRARRDEVLRWLQRFDAELFQAIVAAEGRLGQLLAQYMTGSSPSAEDVVQAAGSKPLEVFAFEAYNPRMSSRRRAASRSRSSPSGWSCARPR